jgi:hypothetical protein
MNGQFISTAGTYFVMSKLALNGIHASCTHGNAPNVDILASSSDGAKSISIQVKTAEEAKRTRGRGEEKKLHHLEFNLGRKAATTNLKNLFFAFVDLDQDYDELPIVYLIPSNFIYEHWKDEVDDYSWIRFHPPIEMVEKFKENWDLIKEALSDDKKSSTVSDI